MPAARAPIGFAACLLAGVLAAQPQPQAAPKFDVVSIRAVPPSTPPFMFPADFSSILPGGQYVHPRASLFEMIAFAYDVPRYMQLVGLPKCTESQSFEVAAKPAPDFPALPPAENREQVRLMLRAMLADRFRLQVHTETRRGSVYNLELAKGGFKIKAVDPPVPPATSAPVGAAFSDSSGRIIGNKATMAGVTSALTIMLSRPVFDQTGLTGYYDFDVKWNSPDPAGRSSEAAFGAEGIALLISTLQDKFGLRLTSATDSIPYWVVDHVEPPSDN